MGLRGPSQTHSRVLQLRGTFRKDRHGTPGAEPSYEPLAALPPAPGFLGDLGAFEWGRVGGELVAASVLCEVHLFALGGYCINLERAVNAQKQVNAEGLTTWSEQGQKAHPAVMICRQSLAEALKFAKSLGITPDSLTRVKVPGAGGGEKPADPWAEVG